MAVLLVYVFVVVGLTGSFDVIRAPHDVFVFVLRVLVNKADAQMVYVFVFTLKFLTVILGPVNGVYII